MYFLVSKKLGLNKIIDDVANYIFFNWKYNLYIVELSILSTNGIVHILSPELFSTNLLMRGLKLCLILRFVLTRWNNLEDD